MGLALAETSPFEIKASPPILVLMMLPVFIHTISESFISVCDVGVLFVNLK